MVDEIAPGATSPNPFAGQMGGGASLGELQPGQYYTDPQGRTHQALMASQRPTPSMPEAIANYLTYTSGQWPQGGIPGVPNPLIGPADQFPGQQSFTRGDDGYYTANPLTDPAGGNAANDQREVVMPGETAVEEPLAPTASGQLIGGMEPEKWLRKYRGET